MRIFFKRNFNENSNAKTVNERKIMVFNSKAVNYALGIKIFYDENPSH